MKASPCLAGLAALALALVVAAVPSATAAPGDNPPARNVGSRYANTAIGAVIDANDGRVPATGAELVSALAQLGDFVQLPVSFSAVALDSGLSHPRVVITLRPSSTAPVKEWVTDGAGSRVAVKPGDPLNSVAANRTQLQGRLFLAANTAVGTDGLKVRTVEFISWNTHRRAFDFGVIEGLHTDAPELKMLDGTRCFSCHKVRGPILGITPWSNTMHNSIVRSTATVAIYDTMKRPYPKLGTGERTDGLVFGNPRAMDVDNGVRLGGELMRDRAIFKRLGETPDTRKGLVLLFEAIVTRGALDKNDAAVRAGFDAIVPARLARDARSAKLNGPSCGLRDFSPAVPVRSSVGADLLRNRVELYDAARAAGQPRLPTEYVPSNPRAFAEPQVKDTQQPSEFMNAVRLAMTMGLSVKDREFLADALDETVKRLKDPAFTRATVARAVFNGPAFTDVLATGNLPDRDDFKDRFVAGIVGVLTDQKRPAEFWKTRDNYASSPKFDPLVEPERELRTLPSHACLACHDVRGAKPGAFNPIPALAFDPFDAAAREAWVKGADNKKKTEVLGRMLQRLGTDRDMPPADSTENELYRKKDPAALNAVTQWIEAELKKVK